MTTTMIERETTQQLIEKAKAADREAFDQLAKSIQDRLRSSVEGWSRFQLGRSVDVEDVLGSVWLAVRQTGDRRGPRSV